MLGAYERKTGLNPLRLRDPPPGFRVPVAIWLDVRFQRVWRDRWAEKASAVGGDPTHRQVWKETRDEFDWEQRREHFDTVAIRFAFRCTHCLASDCLEVDHVVPLSWGGTNDYWNLQILCAYCNTAKGARLPLPPDAEMLGMDESSTSEEVEARLRWLEQEAGRTE